jgi:anti-sigma B factor antagonist
LDQLDVLQSGNTCTLRVKGRLVLGEALDHFDAAVQQALESEHHFLILNLEAMPVIDSSGIGAVVNALVQAKKRGGDAKLVNPSPFATRTFKLMCIHDLFTVFGTEEDAIAACIS